MKILYKLSLVLMTTITLTLASTNILAQSEEQKKDKTGTNPVNFSRDLRIYNEFTWV